MAAAQQINDFFRLLIDDVKETRFVESQVLLLMNRSTHAVLSRLRSEGIYVDLVYEDLNFVANAQEVTLTGTAYKKFSHVILYKFAGQTADSDLVDNVLYPILEEKLARLNEEPCFYHRTTHTFAGSTVYYLGFYRVPSEAFSVRVYFAKQLLSSVFWTTISTDTWGFGYDEGDMQDAIVYKMCQLASMSDTEQRSVWENDYERTINNMIKIHENQQVQTEVVNVMED